MRARRSRLGLGWLGLGLAAALALALAPPAPGQPQPGAVAPDITGAPWINSAPLTIGGLRGRVVLVEFWTYG
jgi:hypothetical protein